MVIFSHGYGNTPDNAIDRIKSAAQETSKAPLNDGDLFFVGYRWPSEKLFMSWSGTLTSAHPILKLAFLIGLLSLIVGIAIVLLWHRSGLDYFGWGLVTFLFGYALLRSSVYYRDAYRAVNYGSLDLVEFVRRLDDELYTTLGLRDRINLSFVGHSMGALVVTTSVRILSDLFEEGSIRAVTAKPKPPEDTSAKEPTTDSDLEPLQDLGEYRAPQRSERPADATPSGAIGHCLCLLRLVLVSPDIPALALLSGRANFLGPSIRRCREAYLFSNGGDVVVGLISISANYLGMPSRLEKNAVRLADVQVRTKAPGLYRMPSNLNKSLRIGPTTLAGLEKRCGGVATPEDQVARLFTYIDCTEFTDRDGKRRLSNLRGRQKPNLWRQILGLISYVAFYGARQLGKDCHSGYFDDPDTNKLIFGSAGIGLRALWKHLPDASCATSVDWVEQRGFRIVPGETLS
ncbi:MAG TPA: hypothetical protein VG944_03945 [Fimbriimonas sp.]|nr:hypothetical protein [Fimbriimonas sp.]